MAPAAADAGVEGLPSPVTLAAPVPPSEAEHSSEHSSSDVALHPGEVLPRAHSSSQTASGDAAAPLPGLPHLPQLRLEEQEPLRITVDAKERLRWSPALHQRFCQAVAELGGSALAKVGRMAGAAAGAAAAAAAAACRRGSRPDPDALLASCCQESCPHNHLD